MLYSELVRSVFILINQGVHTDLLVGFIFLADGPFPWTNNPIGSLIIINPFFGD